MAERWGNCLFYALGKWIRCGGYLVIRRTRVNKGFWRGTWPHFLWSPNLRTFWQFVPSPWWAGWWFPPPIFRGHEQCGNDRDDS